MITRVCTSCLGEYDIDAFPWKNKTANVKACICKQCMREKSKQCYRKNADHYKSKSRQRTILYVARNMRIISKHKLQCMQCGFDHPAALDFHHRDPQTKRKNISKMASEGCSIRELKQEIAKCDVLCSNCHRIIHADPMYFSKPL